LLGFNTFLPEGYKIELPLDNDGPLPFAVYQVPGQPGVTPIIRCHAPPAPAPAAAATARLPQASIAAMRPPPREQPSGGGPPQGPQIPPHSSQPSFGHKPLPSAGTLASIRDPPVPPQPRNEHPIVAHVTSATMDRSYEEALLYLHQVKTEFSARPHIYNELLYILKTFNSQQIDTPGVIRRVSKLLQSDKTLLLGFNTFLPEGYKMNMSNCHCDIARVTSATMNRSDAPVLDDNVSPLHEEQNQDYQELCQIYLQQPRVRKDRQRNTRGRTRRHQVRSAVIIDTPTPGFRALKKRIKQLQKKKNHGEIYRLLCQLRDHTKNSAFVPEYLRDPKAKSNEVQEVIDLCEDAEDHVTNIDTYILHVLLVNIDQGDADAVIASGPTAGSAVPAAAVPLIPNETVSNNIITHAETVGDNSSSIGSSQLNREEEQDYEELRKRFLQPRIRTNEEDAWGRTLRRQIRFAVIDTPTPGFRNLKKQIKELQKKKHHDKIYRFLGQLRDHQIKNFASVPECLRDPNVKCNEVQEVIDVSEDVEEHVIDVDIYTTAGSAAAASAAPLLIPDKATSNKAIDITNAVPLVTEETTTEGIQRVTNNAGCVWSHLTRRSHDSKPGAGKQSPPNVTENVARKKQKLDPTETTINGELSPNQSSSTSENSDEGTHTVVNNAGAASSYSTCRRYDSKPGAREQSPPDFTENVPRKKQKLDPALTRMSGESSPNQSSSTSESSDEGTHTVSNNAGAACSHSTRRNYDLKPGARKQSPPDFTENVPRKQKLDPAETTMSGELRPNKSPSTGQSNDEGTHTMRAFSSPLRFGASFFAFIIIGLDIPLFSVLTRYHLVNSGLRNQRLANWLLVYIPWGLSWVFHQGNAIATLLSWGGVIFTSLVAFILPLAPLYTLIYKPGYGGAIAVHNQGILSHTGHKSTVLALLALAILVWVALLWGYCKVRYECIHIGWF
jgi:hypothetical protein